MFGGWFKSQQIGSNCDNGTPIAPLSLQGAAERWEPSVQNMVCERGGLKIAALEEAIATTWALKFKIVKAWRLKDAISDKGIHAYIQHHWLILKLLPARSSSRKHNRSGKPSEGQSAEQARMSEQDEAMQHPPSLSRDSLDSERSFQSCKSLECQISGGDGVGETKILTSEKHLTAAEETSFGPQTDKGMQLANQGNQWYLRIDRFDEADKWFACESFENAMSSKQAREKHYQPSSEIMYEASTLEECLYLDNLVPMLSKLADIKYSVFARGNHCQWHALLVARMIATMHEFAFPGTLSREYQTQVSSILTDMTEQKKYVTMCAKTFYTPDDAYLKNYPEAAYLKDQFRSLQEFAANNEGAFPLALQARKFPNLQFLTEAILKQSSSV